MTTTHPTNTSTRAGTLGTNAYRPDGVAKVQGGFAFSSDMWSENMLWGATLRSPHPYAKIISIDDSAALAIDGVECVVTAQDVPGNPYYGLIMSDQPVFAAIGDTVRYCGEPIAAVAADHPETCKRALAAIKVVYEILTPVTNPQDCVSGIAPQIHPQGNVYRHQRIITGDQSIVGDVIVEGTYEIGMQDQAFLGLESALAIPDSGGEGLELYVATQWLHEDRKQIAACLNIPEDKIRLVLGGVGGAFGAREDISLQVHTCLLALKSGRPVRISYGREESFYGHVHRHPATIWMRHHADRNGKILKIESTMLFDGGAYCSTSPAVLINAITHTQGPYKCDTASVEGWAVRTNNPPCGAMRGFGVVQACFAHESQMEKLSVALGLSPVEIRLRNVMETGDRLITGQIMDSVAPVEQCIRETDAIAMPEPLLPNADIRQIPGGTGLTAQPGNIVRGVGWGVSMKNLMYSEGFDDYSTARCRMTDGVVSLKFATSEVGQGFTMLAQQIARTILGVNEVLLDTIDTQVGSAGSTSASRQTWMSGGAVKAACEKVLEDLFDHAALTFELSRDHVRIEETDIVDILSGRRIAVSEASKGVNLDRTEEYHHPPTEDLDENGQGNCHVAFAFVAHRAVVDVDVELGLVKVVQIATAQDVGRILNPISVQGQVEGGIAQGLGLAVMEEIIVKDGKVRNPSFTDYLLPTFLDAPLVEMVLIEEFEPKSPLGAKGVGEPPCISVTPAIANAIRNATGRELPRVPIRPYDICL
ncbi:carbon-monoxide dehydrogenase large subunit [Actinomycetes bacterium]|nr:carbon-monoxide dehydrogenase large subunit [Actinomycetes bacterium]